VNSKVSTSFTLNAIFNIAGKNGVDHKTRHKMSIWLGQENLRPVVKSNKFAVRWDENGSLRKSFERCGFICCHCGTLRFWGQWNKTFNYSHETSAQLRTAISWSICWQRRLKENHFVFK